MVQQLNDFGALWRKTGEISRFYEDIATIMPLS
jgi:hypothetical protein